MELVYLYIQEAYGKEYDLHLDFSSNTKIMFDKETQKFSIETIENGYPSDFFGDNIKNITAIVGRNGAGKTTILDIMSLKKTGFRGREWIIVYKKNQDYYIEGNIKTIAKDIDTRVNKSSYSFKGKITDRFEVEDYLQMTEEFSKGICYLSLLPDQNNQDDILFKRIPLNKDTLMSFFNFITSGRFNSFFKVNKNYSFYLDLSKPQVLNDDDVSFLKESDRQKILEFMKRMNNFYNITYDEMLKEKDNEYCKRKYITHCSRIFFDTFFYFIIFLMNEYPDNEAVYKEVMSDLNSTLLELEKSPKIDNYSILIGCIENLKKDYWRYFNGYIVEKSWLQGLEIEFRTFIEALEKIDNKCFEHASSLKIDASLFDEYLKEITIIIKTVDIFQYNTQVTDKTNFIVTFGGFSSGENSLFILFSRIYNALQTLKEENYQLIIILLDEYEIYLHPEWSRLFLQYLIEFLQTYENQNFQIALTTHSPYLISDLPKENIRLITKDETTGKRKVSIPKHGFASNYYDILSDSFFLEDTIGEFAKQKINSWITELNNLEESAISDREKLARIDEIKKLIMIVDDQFIRNKLLELAEDVKNKIIKNADKSLQESLIDAEIAKLEAMKERLRTEEKND